MNFQCFGNNVDLPSDIMDSVQGMSLNSYLRYRAQVFNGFSVDIPFLQTFGTVSYASCVFFIILSFRACVCVCVCVKTKKHLHT